MSRLSALVVLAVICLGLSYLASCSDPLEINNSSPDPGPAQIDTVYIFDTLVPSDSAVRIDTIRITDTVRVHDTGACVDTVTHFDTISVTDTHVVVDTFESVDTVKITDTNSIIDTLTLTDTVVVTDTNTIIDTMTLFDTVVVTDTNTIFDTTTLIDTVTITETKTIFDTVNVTDTLVQVDTVTIVKPGDCDPQQVCGRIAAGQKDILWMFRNEAGMYRLEMSGATEKNKPLQTLVIAIGGTKYTWVAGTNPLWVKELVLSANTSIRISLESPYACGHDISICLVMTKL